jgi:hypothetical protein
LSHCRELDTIFRSNAYFPQAGLCHPFSDGHAIIFSYPPSTCAVGALPVSNLRLRTIKSEHPKERELFLSAICNTPVLKLPFAVHEASPLLRLAPLPSPSLCLLMSHRCARFTLTRDARFASCQRRAVLGDRPAT